jgi:hypothetical protein
VVSGDNGNPFQDVTSGQAEALRASYRLEYQHYVPGLTVFLLVGG